MLFPELLRIVINVYKLVIFRIIYMFFLQNPYLIPNTNDAIDE